MKIDIKKNLANIAKELKDGNTAKAIDLLKETSDNIEEESVSGTSEATEDESSNNAEVTESVSGTSEATEDLKEEITKMKEEIKKWVDMYVSANDTKELLDEIKQLSSKVEDITKSLDEVNERTDQIEKVQWEVSSMQKSADGSTGSTLTGIFF